NFSSSYPFFPAGRPVFHGFHGLRRLSRESQSASSPHFLPPPRRVSSAFLLTSLLPKALIFGLFPHDRLPLPWDQTAPRTSLGGLLHDDSGLNSHGSLPRTGSPVP